MPDVHWCVTVDYQQIVDSNIANQIHGFTIDYGKFILMLIRLRALVFYEQIVNEAQARRKRGQVV